MCAATSPKCLLKRERICSILRIADMCCFVASFPSSTSYKFVTGNPFNEQRCQKFASLSKNLWMVLKMVVMVMIKHSTLRVDIIIDGRSPAILTGAYKHLRSEFFYSVLGDLPLETFSLHIVCYSSSGYSRWHG